MEITDKVREIIEPLTAGRGYFIVDITYKRAGGDHVLRVFLDKEGGITVDDCARLNNELGELLDKEDFIKEHYLLEISSPGLDRKLKTDNDFTWAVGKRVKITTYALLDGKNVFTGALVGTGKEAVVVEESGVSLEIPKNKIASAKLDIDINWSEK